MKWCERGRGLKPDWTSKGMDFLMFAANPENTKFIPDEEFEVRLNTNVNLQISFVQKDDYATLLKRSNS